jgi:acyl dehydratase
MITRLDAFDENDQPVFTEHIGGLMRGVSCLDKGRTEAGVPNVLAPESEPSSAWESSILIDDLMPYVYDGCTRIHFPIHTSRQFAHWVGLPDIILQGTATLSLAVREVVNREAKADPRRVKSIACRFTDIVIPGERIIIQASRVDPLGNVCFQVKKATGQRAIRHGVIKLDTTAAAIGGLGGEHATHK